MGSSVADVTRSLGSKSVNRLAESSIDPRELLWGILHTLSQIRGSPSYLFPALLEQCKNLLGLDCSITMGNFLPTLGVAGSDWAGEHGWNMLNNDHEREPRQLDSDQIEPPLSAISQRAGVGFGAIFCSDR